LAVSFSQEELMGKIKTIDRTNPQYLKLIQQQKKIKDDVYNLQGKIKSLSNKIDGFSRENNLCCCTISLFSDFHLVKNGNKLEVKYVLDRPGYKSGVFAKYGRTVSDKSGNYLSNYKEELKKVEISNRIISDNLDLINKNPKAVAFLNIRKRLFKSYQVAGEIINHVDEEFKKNNTSLIKEFNSRNLIEEILKSNKGIILLEKDLVDFGISSS
jgi:hypothetical protein